MLMNILITSDSDWQAKLSKVTDELYKRGYKDFFQERDYGPGLDSLCAVLMCRDPALKFKRRIRLSKKESTLYMDTMLDLTEMVGVGDEDRRRIVIERLLIEVPEVISRYKIDNFDSSRFVSEWTGWLRNTGWVQSTNE
jgi:hypothetical protein